MVLGGYQNTSGIYKWDGAQFALIQSFSDSSQIDHISYATLGIEQYMLVDTLALTKLYIWDGAVFTLSHTFPKNGSGISKSEIFTDS